MTGLLIKDFRLLKVQKNFFTLIVFILLGMILFSEDNFFAVSFATFIFSLFSTSTVSYDEFDNGNPFLFSLPVTRKGYVLEKYCFGLIFLLGVLAVKAAEALHIDLAFLFNSLSSLSMSALILGAIAVMLLLLLLSLKIKYGCHEPKRVLTKSCGTTDLLSVPQLFSAIRTKPPADVSVRNLFHYFCNSSAS